MAIIKRRIDGPQNFHEQRGGIAFRDTRTPSEHLREMLSTGFSAIVLVVIGIVACVVPALVTIMVPIAVAFAVYVLTRPVTLPMRLPVYAKGLDLGNPEPDPKRKGVEIAGRPMGDWFIGWDEFTGQQLWLSGEDLTMHCTLPGATGSGKTQFIYSFLCNALAQGSGFTIVDGKASNKLIFSVMAMARRWGREADVRVINLMVSSGDRRTNTWNPFAAINAEGLTELLLMLFLPDQPPAGGDGQHFQNRAQGLIRGMVYVFVWVRDHLRIPLTAETIRAMFSDIEALRLLYQERLFRFYDFASSSIKVVKLPEDFEDVWLGPVRDYVVETGGFSNGKDVSQQDKVREQHSYVVGGFGKTFTLMTVTLGHVFRCDSGDIDFRDVLYNRRILVVLLPALENTPETNAALGKAVITALRYALAASLGTSIEGSYEDLVLNRPSAAKTPYPIVLDEVGQFVTKGVDLIGAQGRELNVSMFLSFQEVGTLYAMLGRDLTVPLLGNPKLKIIQNLEDAGPTRQWVEETGGTMQVSTLPGYDNSSPLGVYADQQRADIRETKRISWSDIQSLRPGQAIVLFRGRRIYTRLFYAGIEPEGINRVFPTLPFKRGSSPEHVSATPQIEIVAQKLASGAAFIEEGGAGRSGPLDLICTRLASIIEREASPMQDAEELLNLLEISAAETGLFSGLFRNRVEPDTQRPRSTEPLDESIDRILFEDLVAFEIAAGDDPRLAHESVTHSLNLYAQGQRAKTIARQDQPPAVSVTASTNPSASASVNEDKDLAP